MADKGDGQRLLKQGAEAKIYETWYLGKPAIAKERFKKSYRHPKLDASLTSKRTKSEARAIMRCRMLGIKTPALYFVDSDKIIMEHVQDSITVRDHICQVFSESRTDPNEALIPIAEVIGNAIGRMHDNNIIHGDLTTSNMLLRQSPLRDDASDGDRRPDVVMIDFGLGYVESVAEDKAVDLYVLERALLSTHPRTERFFQALLDSYLITCGKQAQEVMRKLDEVRLRGRKRTMVG